jgi:hypothetical protein
MTILDEVPTEFGFCLVCDTPITEERYWAAKSRTKVAPETCGAPHQMLLAVRRSRGLDAKGAKVEKSARRKKRAGK